MRRSRRNGRPGPYRPPVAPTAPRAGPVSPWPARDTAQGSPVSGERNSRETKIGDSSSASMSNTRARLDICSAAATTASVNPLPPLTLVQALSLPLGVAGRPPMGPYVRAGRPPAPADEPRRGPSRNRWADSSAGGIAAARVSSTPRPTRYSRPAPDPGSKTPTTWVPWSWARATSDMEKVRITSSMMRTSSAVAARSSSPLSMITRTERPWPWSRT